VVEVVDAPGEHDGDVIEVDVVVPLRVDHVNPESLLVHWRRKDEAAFAAIRDAINARILR
jgi:hypothetical protein